MVFKVFKVYSLLYLRTIIQLKLKSKTCVKHTFEEIQTNTNSNKIRGI